MLEHLRLSALVPLAWTATLSLTLALCPVAHASVSFDFVQDNTGVTLATLEFSIDPPFPPYAWQGGDIAQLIFSPAGDVVFGLGAGVYGGTFTDSLHSAVIDGTGLGLESSVANEEAVFRSYDAPFLNRPDYGRSLEVKLFFGARALPFLEQRWIASQLNTLQPAGP